MAYSSIVKPSVYFDTELWSSVDTSIDTLDFQPDWVWIKSRTNADTQVLFDAVRGVTKRLSSSGDAAESTRTDELTAFNSDGFTIGTGDNVNRASNNYVAWNWKAGGGQGSSNTDGSINTTYTSVNTTAGFSISSFTGTGANATFGHGLGAVPKMYILKRYDASNNWRVYHEGVGNGKYMTLETTQAEQTSSGFTNNTSPTSSLISLGNLGSANPSGGSVICYAFAEKTGYSKFGSYTGNGSTDGTFVYTGFKPAFVIIKRTDGGSNDWVLYDTKRCINGVENALEPNTNNSESTVIAKTNYNIDLISNGFKCRSNSDQINNGSYIYMAFAEEPLVANSGTDGVPATAR